MSMIEVWNAEGVGRALNVLGDRMAVSGSGKQGTADEQVGRACISSTRGVVSRLIV
jgi:hypothetical protein